ncbi:MAG TPA: hypothetical protein VLA89_00605 [Gemmatimonadales bacterium]|nr:hypothetical protein [Gemmatimonadales bacterium]
MALFMSERQKVLTVRNQEEKFSQATGKKIGTQRRVFAEFRKGGVPPWALETAEKTFRMAGKPPEIPTHMWLATYDSEIDKRQRRWTDEEHELILEALRAKPGVVEIAMPVVDPPYAKYDQHRKTQGKRTLEHVLADIKNTFEVAGFSVEQALRYERDNLADAKVIEFLESLATEEEEAEPLMAV